MRIESEHIKSGVARYFHCLPSQLDQKSRKRSIVIMRQIAHYLAVKYNSGIYTDIASEIGKGDHATVNHSIKAINNAIKTGERHNGTRIEQIVKDCEDLACEEKYKGEQMNNVVTENECEFIMC